MENNVKEKPKCYKVPLDYCPEKCSKCPLDNDCIGNALSFWAKNE